MPWRTSGPSRALDPYSGLRLTDDPTLTSWEKRFRKPLHTDMPLIPWHTSGPSRAMDPYFGERLSDEHLVPITLAPWKRPLRTHMSLVPWHTSGPSRALDPYVGLRLDNDEILDPLTMGPWEGKFVPFRSYSWDTLFSTDAESSTDESKGMFEVNVDVQHFKPKEIKVTLLGNTLTVEGKHEEKPDEHGYISRHFVRKYNLPEDHDLDQVQSHLSSDGVLTITVPKIPADGNLTRNIPIQQTGKLKKRIENK